MRRRLWVGASLLALGTATALAVLLYERPPPPIPIGPVPEAPAIPSGPLARPDQAGHVSILWAGDTLIGDAASKLIRKEGVDIVFRDLGGTLEADYSILNLEAPITKLRRRDMPKSIRPWSYNLHPNVAPALVRAGFDAVGFSNNHTFDRREQGVLDTIEHTTAAGLRLFGAGKDDVDAAAPLLIDTPYGRVGVVALTYKAPESLPAGPESPGAIFTNSLTIKGGIARARAEGAKWVVGFAHWGINYEDLEPAQRSTAVVFEEAGFDLLIGTGPHVQQPLGMVEDMPVLYSLGNFVFNTPGRFQKLGNKKPYGLVATTFLGPEGFDRIELRCLLVDNLRVHYVARPCNEEERAESYAALGEQVTVEGEVAVYRR